MKMTNMQPIEIDFEVHKAIEIARNSFAESPNAVLRRLLKIGAAAPVTSQTVGGRAWTGKGVELPSGTKLRMSYNGSNYNGEVVDGVWITEVGNFTSPSGASNALALTKDGSKTSLNGWNYWEAQLPGTSKWRTIKSMLPSRRR